jgi:hypothetical protein
VSTPQRNDPSMIAVDRRLADILRLQTFAVMEVNHEPFEDFRMLRPAERQAVGAVYRDAIAVLDAIGWTPGPGAAGSGPTNVTLTAGHVAQLRRLRDDLDRTILDRRATRAALRCRTAIRHVYGAILFDSVAARGLGELLVACDAASTA